MKKTHELIKKKFNLILLFIVLYIFVALRQKIFKEKICICTLGKEENKYIREWSEHYLKYGIDKIYLYDNNDINGEHFESAIGDYIKNGFVEILNWRGKTKLIYKVMNDCYKRNNNNYDWLLFYELDEFIHLSNFTSIQDYLNERRFDKCKIIYLNLLVHNDNNQLFYKNLSLFERFPNIVPKKIESRLQVKMIIKGGIKDLIIKTTAQCYLSNNKYNLTTCNGFGNLINLRGFYAKITDYNLYYIDHFFCKSTEEFINKLKKGDSLQTGKALQNYKIERIKRYFKYNVFTDEKIKMIVEALKISLSNFKTLKRNK